MSGTVHQVEFADEQESREFAQRLGAVLDPGDSVMLAGPVGAGKSLICRALIQSLLNEAEDIPSPTYTLVQTYETRRGPLWHADLYRLTDPGEVMELGLEEAFQSAICLVEWPDRLGGLAPNDALMITLQPVPEADDARNAIISWSHQKWTERLSEVADV